MIVKMRVTLKMMKNISKSVLFDLFNNSTS